MKNKLHQTTAESEIVNSRIFHFSREQVFKAWKDADYLKQWLGPKGFTNTFHEFDFRVGGHWRFTMHGPEAGHYENHAEFLLIEEPSRIAWKRHSKPLFHILATFDETSKNECQLVFKMLFESAEECAKLRPYVIEKNEENFDRLEIVLQQMA